MKNFIDPIDFTNQQLLDLAELSLMLKRFDKMGACPELLKGKSLGMIFEESSTRTRISFEVAMTKLGGTLCICVRVKFIWELAMSPFMTQQKLSRASVT
ncbi:hypothetical protein MACH09_33120 [Vibrio sp. MACH09]|nr:hypothetical protein [Vibrio sp. MACH09]GLO62804.1 hypothetical protein MACH09_33120 [Vibrio sp. MACH09]